MEADALAKAYWNVSHGLAALDDLDARIDKAVGAFANPTDDTSVRAAYVLRFLDRERLDRFLIRFYKRPASIRYDPVAMLLAAVPFRVLKGLRSWDALADHLKEYPEDALDLGFLLQDGRPRVPKDGETLRHFVHHRLGPTRLEGLMDLLVELLRDAFDKAGLTLGRCVGEDGTPLPTNGKDPEACYNDHYGVLGYNVDIVMDVEHDVPLVKHTMVLTGNEGANLVPALERLDALGIRPQDAWFDGHYSTFENLAYLGTRGIRAHYKVLEAWVVHPEASAQGIRAAYQAHWSDEAFRPEATLDEQLRFLRRHGRADLVGAHYRNDRMAEWEECADGVREDCGPRSHDEGLNGHAKRSLDFEHRFYGRGLGRADVHAACWLLALQLVALVRVAHGVTTGLTRTRGFT